MPRRNQDPQAEDAASTARRRLRSRLGATEPFGAAELSDQAGSGANEEPLLPRPDRDVHEFGRDSGPPGRLRWRVSWRIPALLLVPVLLLAVWLGWQAWAGQPAVEPLEANGAGASSPGPAGGGAETGDPAGRRIVVHVAGAVKKPGIVSLSEGARVFEAISAAGGASPGASLDSLNLAAVLQDGAKIQVLRQGEAPPPAPGSGTGADGGAGAAGPGSGGAAGMDAKININSASAAELDELPRVGPVLAERIVAWREEHGPFAAVEELDAVDGVGPKMLETLLPLVTV